MPTNSTEPEIEETQAALRASLERAHELICEAKQRIRPQEEAEPQPPNPAG
jgi:hypothetical protein